MHFLLALAAGVPLIVEHAPPAPIPTSPGAPAVVHQGDNPFASLGADHIRRHCAKIGHTCHEDPGGGVIMEKSK